MALARHRQALRRVHLQGRTEQGRRQQHQERRQAARLRRDESAASRPRASARSARTSRTSLTGPGRPDRPRRRHPRHHELPQGQHRQGTGVRRSGLQGQGHHRRHDVRGVAARRRARRLRHRVRRHRTHRRHVREEPRQHRQERQDGRPSSRQRLRRLGLRPPAARSSRLQRPFLLEAADIFTSKTIPQSQKAAHASPSSTAATGRSWCPSSPRAGRVGEDARQGHHADRRPGQGDGAGTQGGHHAGRTPSATSRS